MSDFGIQLSGRESNQDRIRKYLEDYRRSRITSAATFAVNQDPNRVAEASRHNLPLTASDAVLQQAKSQAAVQTITDQIRNFPVASDFFADPTFASLAYDDTESIGFLEGAFSTVVSTVSPAVRGLIEQFGDAPSPMGAYGYFNPYGQPSPQERAGALDAGVQWWDSFAQPFEQTAQKAFGDSLVGQAGLSAIQSIGQVLGAGLLLGRGAVLPTFYLSGYGGSMQKARAMGISPDDAQLTAKAVGLTEVILGSLPVLKLFSGSLGSTYKQVMSRYIAAELVTEIPTTVIQESIEFFGYDKPQTAEDYQRFYESLPRAIAVTALSTIFSAGGTGSVVHYVQNKASETSRSIEQAQRNDQALQSAEQAAQQSKLAGRSANVFRRYADALAEANRVDDLRIDRDVLIQASEPIGGVDAVAAAIPSISTQLQSDDIASSGEIVISPGEWLIAVRNNPAISEALRQHFRAGNQDLSVTEAAQVQEDAERFLSDIEALIEEETQVLVENESERQDIENEIIRNVLGQDPINIAAEPQAEQVAEVAAVPPEQQQPVEPVAEAAAQQQAEIEQPAQQVAAEQVAPDVQQVAAEVGAAVEQVAETVEQPVQPVQPPAPPAREDESDAVWFQGSKAADVKGQPLELTMTFLAEDEGPVFVEAPAGTGDTIASIRNPAVLTGNRANAFVKNKKAREREIKKAQAAGRDGVIAHAKTTSGGRVSRESVYLPFDGKQTRKLDRPAPGALEAPRVSNIDAAYMAAVEAGDMETAQRLVLDAAKRAGYSEQVYEHATDQEFDVFDINAPVVNAARGGNPAGLYFSLGQTKYEGKRTVRAVLKYTKLYDLFGGNEIPDSAVQAYKQALRDEKLSSDEFWLNEKADRFKKTGRMPTTGLSRLAQTRVIQRAGYDGIKDGRDVAVFSPEQVKVVDPITRDAEGNIIPLSQRFDVTQESILYAPGGTPGSQLVTQDQLKQQALIVSSMFSNLARSLGMKPKAFWAKYGAKVVTRDDPNAPPGQYLPNSMTVVLNTRQEADTLLHEMTHHYLNILSVIASDPAPTEDQADGVSAAQQLFSDIIEEFDTDNVLVARGPDAAKSWNLLTAEQQAAIHERLVYSFTKYVGTGQAPTAKLKKAFRKLSEWFKALYGGTFQKLDEAYKKRFNIGPDEQGLPAMTDSVRSICDRMLAGELAVIQARAAEGMAPLWMSLEESGLTQEQWDALQQQRAESDQEAIETMTSRFVRDEKWGLKNQNRFIRGLQKQAREVRAGITNEVRAEVERRPVYLAIRFLRSGERLLEDGTFAQTEGKYRLNSAMVKQLFPKADLSKMRGGRYGMTAKDGVDPDTVAPFFGYESGAKMIQDILDAKPLKEVVAKEAEVRMKQEHADLVDPVRIREAAILSIQNERTSRSIAMEESFLSGATTPPRLMVLAARNAATQRIEKMTVRDIRPDRYATQAKRKSRESVKALKAGDRAAALRAKRQQLGSDQMAFVGREVRDQIAKHKKYLRKFAGASKLARRNKRVGADYGDVLDVVLSRLVDERGPLSVVRVGEQTKGLGWYLGRMRQKEMTSKLENETPRQPAGWEGEEPATLFDEILAMPAAGTNINDLTFEQLEDIVEIIHEIEHIGVEEQRGELASNGMRLSEVASVLEAAVNSSKGLTHQDRTATTLWERFKSWVSDFVSVEHRSMATKAYDMDGGKFGAWFDNVINVASQIEDSEINMISEYTKKLADILAPIIDVKGLNKKQWIPELGDSFSKLELFTMALNLGNVENAQRLLNNGKGKWTVDMVRAAIGTHLNEQQIRAVQQVWDVFKALRPIIAKMERQERGVEPAWVKARPVTFNVGGKSVILEGGYFPIRYDPKGSETGATAEAAAEADSAERQLAARSTTSRTFVKRRAREVKDAPILLNIDGLYRSLEEIIHDIHWRQFGRDMNRLLGPKTQLSRAIQAKFGSAWLNDIRRWRNYVVSGTIGETSTQGDKLVSLIGRGTSAKALLYNTISLLKQPIGMLAVGAATGYRNMFYGIRRALNWGDAKREMMEKSPQLKLRFQTRFREFGEIQARIRGKTGLAQRFEQFGYMLLQKSQSIADTVAWHAGYAKAIEDGYSEAKAADVAYQTVLDTQSSGRRQDLSTVELGKLGRLFSTFYRPMNAQLNLLMRSSTHESRAKFIADSTVILMVVPYLMYLAEELVRPDVDDDEEKWTLEHQSKVFLVEGIKSTIGSFAYIREFSNLAGSMIDEGFSYRGPSRLALVGEGISLGQQIFEIPEKGFDAFDRSMAKAAISVLGGLGWPATIPSVQINKMIDAMFAIDEGEDVPAIPAVIFGVDR